MSSPSFSPPNLQLPPLLVNRRTAHLVLVNDQREHPSSSLPLIISSCPGFSSGTDVTDVTYVTDVDSRVGARVGACVPETVSVPVCRKITYVTDVTDVDSRGVHTCWTLCFVRCVSVSRKLHFCNGCFPKMEGGRCNGRGPCAFLKRQLTVTLSHHALRRHLPNMATC